MKNRIFQLLASGMKLRKMKIEVKILTIILLMILVVPSVLSIGITPGRTTLNYEENKEEEISFSVLNNERKNMQVIFMIQGELNNSVTLFTNDEDGIIDFLPNEESKQFKYKLKMPSRIANEPGLHTAEIVSLEIPKINSGGTLVGATTAVISQIYVYVPCPGKCIEADFEVLDAEKNSTATFIVPIINRGKLGIGEVRAIIDIYDSSNNKIDSLETDYWPVPSGGSTELSAKWNVSVSQGEYLAKISVFYDGETKNFEKRFEIGVETLSIESIFANNFRLGEVAQLQVLVENKKDKDLENVFANLMVFNEQNQVMADVKSADVDIKAYTKDTLVIYWDTIGVQEGEYNGKLMVIYDKKSKDKHLVLKISQDSLDIFGVGYAIRPKGSTGVSITKILTVLIIILIITNISWIVFFKFFGKKLK